MRQSQKRKLRKPAVVKSIAPIPRHADPLPATALTHSMDQHCEWMGVTGYSEHTVKTRRVALRRFIVWCHERSLARPQDITRPILERYQTHLFYYRKEDGQPLTLGTQLGCLAPLKTWFKWLARAHHLLYNPASELQLPRLPQHLPRGLLSIEEVEAILNQAEPTTAYGLRDRALLEVLYSTGLRRMELPRLALYDVDLNRRLVFVREGKGRRDRVIPIGKRAAAWLEKYLIEARPELLTGESEALFLSDYGEAITPAYLAAKVRHYMRFAHVIKPGATHLFRHACATHMLEGGADIRYIQAMLGHASIESTEVYTHVSIDKLKAIHDATHPAKLERSGGKDAAEDADAAEDV